MIEGGEDNNFQIESCHNEDGIYCMVGQSTRKNWLRLWWGQFRLNIARKCWRSYLGQLKNYCLQTVKEKLTPISRDWRQRQTWRRTWWKMSRNVASSGIILDYSSWYHIPRHFSQSSPPGLSLTCVCLVCVKLNGNKSLAYLLCHVLLWKCEWTCMKDGYMTLKTKRNAFFLVDFSLCCM